MFKIFKWFKGRQGSGYDVLTLCKFNNFDMYIIKISNGIEVPEHTDKVPNKRHFRLNIEIIKPEEGGIFIGKTVFNWKRITLIRPDINVHSVTKIQKGYSLIFSIGWTLKLKEDK